MFLMESVATMLLLSDLVHAFSISLQADNQRVSGAHEVGNGQRAVAGCTRANRVQQRCSSPFDESADDPLGDVVGAIGVADHPEDADLVLAVYRVRAGQ